MSKTDSAGTANYVTDGSSPASAVIKDGNAVYTPGLSEHRGSASKFYHADALGSTRGITDNTQAVTDSLRYDAFGNVVSRTGTTPTPFGFAGAKQYQTDGDSGLQLLGHRYYDPSIGRFLSSDPAKAGTNWYAYCGNNPLVQTDPLGLESILQQMGNFLLGELKGFGDQLGGGGLPGMHNSFAPKSVGQGGSESQNDGYAFGHYLGMAFAVFAILTDGGGIGGGGLGGGGTGGEVGSPPPGTNSGQPLYHYGPDPIPVGSELNPGTWVTNNPNMGPSEASAITGVYSPPNYVHETFGDPGNLESIGGWEEIAPGQWQGQLREGGPVISRKPINRY